MKFKYEPPKLVSLNGEMPAMGADCCSGSSNDIYCSNGGCASNDCGTGTNSGFFCTNGNTASQKCCTGNGPGWTYNCWSGNCPARPAGCGYGGTTCQLGNSAGVGDPSC
jgi:hypothetical protein